MRVWPAAGILISAILAGPSAHGAPAFTLPAEEAATYKNLPAGRYEIKIIGMLTTTCGRGIEIEVMKRPEVESARVDFETETLFLTVKLSRTLRLSALRRALRSAAERIDLGAGYSVGRITFLP
jgi:hypothetical protein